MKYLALLFLLLASPAFAQVQQSGNVTPGHAASWTTNGVIQDGGTAAQGFLTSLGVIASGPGICQNSAAVSGPYNQICLSVTSSGGQLSLNNYNGATGGLTLAVNGATINSIGAISPITVNAPTCFNDTNGNIKTCQLAATTLWANPTGSSAVPQGVTLGSTLGFSGTTLNATTATTGQLGVVEPDGTTITINGSGVITAVGAVATSIDAGGATAITNGTASDCLYQTSSNKVGVTPCGNAMGGAGGRLTLASGTPVMGATSCGSAACSAQGTIYYDCYNGTIVPYYNGSSTLPDTITSCEVSMALATSGTGVVNANDVFDVWWVHSGTNRICVATNGSGGGWSADSGGSVTARGTGYTQLNRSTAGYPTNANSLAHCYNGTTNYGSVSANQATYLGSFATTGSAGKVSYVFGSGASGGGAAFFGLWNYYNRITVATSVVDTQSPYTYSSATVRQAEGSAGNQISFVFGLAEDNVEASYFAYIGLVSTLGAYGNIALGFDSTTVAGCQVGAAYNPVAAANFISPTVKCNWTPTAGIHTLAALESGDGTHNNTFDESSTNNLSASLRM
jgi:hypothetical protein